MCHRSRCHQFCADGVGGVLPNNDLASSPDLHSQQNLHIVWYSVGSTSLSNQRKAETGMPILKSLLEDLISNLKGTESFLWFIQLGDASSITGYLL